MYPDNTFDYYSAMLSSIMDPKVSVIILDKAKISRQKSLLVHTLEKNEKLRLVNKGVISEQNGTWTMKEPRQFLYSQGV